MNGVDLWRFSSQGWARKAMGRCAFLLALFCVWGGAASAQVALPSTRIVIDAARTETAVPMQNRGESPVLVQAWISDDAHRKSPEESGAPFVLMPPLMRIDAGKDKHLRIRTLASSAPLDKREHMYWLNVLVIKGREGVEAADTLEIPVRSVYKVLYRPKGLASPPKDRARDVDIRLHVDGEQRFLVISNRTAYYFNLGTVAVVHGGVETRLQNPYAAPFNEVSIPIPDETPAAISAVRLTWIDDDGRLHPVEEPLR